MKFRNTSCKASFVHHGKRYTRKVYEFLDPDTGWWRECIKLREGYIPLDYFEDVTIRDEGAYMPGTWAAY